MSAIVRGQRAVFLEELEPEVRVLDPRETQVVVDPSAEHGAGIQLIDALLRELPPEGTTISVGDRAALDVLDFQLDPARRALRQLWQRILIADAVGLGTTLEAGILLSELGRRGRAGREVVRSNEAAQRALFASGPARPPLGAIHLDSIQATPMLIPWRCMNPSPTAGGPTSDRWVSVTDVAECLGVARDTVYRWIEAKGLPAYRVGWHWMFKLDEVHR